MVHVPAKFQKNTSMRFWVTVRKLNVTDRQTDRRTDRRTDRQTDGGRCNISFYFFNVENSIKRVKKNQHPPPPQNFLFVTNFFFFMLEIAWNAKKTWNIETTFHQYQKLYSTPPWHGARTYRNVSKCSPHHNGDICTTRGNNLKTSFSYMSQNINKIVYFGLFRGPWGGLQW